MRIVAIVTTLDNLPNLKDSIAILRQDPLVSQIIVVNQQSEDGTAEWLAEQPDLLAINRQNNGAGPGRNAGLDAAGKFDYALLLDGGMRCLINGNAVMLDYLNRHPEVDVIGTDWHDLETDPALAWRRWPKPIEDNQAYRNRVLSLTNYCLARWRAFEDFRFSEEGPFAESSWGCDDDELAHRWTDAGIIVHAAQGIKAYRRGSGSFRRLFKETGIWPTQYGSGYEKRLVWLQQNQPHHMKGLQWGEPWLTVVVRAGETEPTIELIKQAHDLLRQRCFAPPWDSYPNPYSIVAWGVPALPFWDWAQWRNLRQHHGDTTIIDGEIVRRNPVNEGLWTGDFRMWQEDDWRGAIRPNAYYYGLVEDEAGLIGLVDRYNEAHPTKPTNHDYPTGRGEL